MTPLRAARAFAFEGRPLAARRHGRGHIHASFALSVERGGGRARYLLQRLNTHVFRDPDALCENVARVGAHLRARLAERGVQALERRVLRLVPTHAGGFVHHADDGSAWRAYDFVEGARAARTLSPGRAQHVATAFAEFQRLLADYDGPRLHETLPGFHDTPRRCAAFREALALDLHGRAASARAEIEFALAHEAFAACLVELRDAGRLPERVTHNDAKLDNVLLDDVTGEGLCVIDLDTVMPGLSLYDFGDLVRSVTSRAAEDEPDTARVDVDVELFAAVARGWRAGLGDALLPLEREHLLTAGRLITFETGLRFLTDYLDGDRYFRIARPAHNLLRCRAQFALVRALERRADELRAWL